MAPDPTPSKVPFGTIRELFDQVTEADPATAERLLAELSSRDPAAHAELQGLLRAHHSAGEVWERPVWQQVGIDGATLGEPLRVGERLGPWAVTRKVGEGGMGAVYEAERADASYVTRAAIKTLGSGMLSASLMRRFLRERQILARMTHPNIATLLDGGASERGVPYLVMEYVDGLPLDRYCETHRLTIAARIDLFRQVCEAVEFAHRHLVVHRDLKPGNILVTRDGVVKLLDFGIAKLVSAQDAAEGSTQTQVALTTAYASPEQARGEDITTATDVYSLGVVLYRLLAGVPPYDLDGQTPAGVLAVLSDTQPPLPSQVASSEHARACALGSEEVLRRVLRGGLDDIVMMALRKDAVRRYPSVAALSHDLHQYQRGMVISARPDTMAYRISTFVKRRRALVAASTLAVISMVAGTVVSLRQAQLARAESRRAQTITRYLSGIVGAADPSHYTAVRTGKLDVGLMEVLDSTRSKMGRELGNEPRIRADLYWSMANAYRAFGRHALALQLHDSARMLHTMTVGDHSLEVARDVHFRGVTLQELAQFDSAAATFREAARRYAALPSPPDTEVTDVMASLGQILGMALNELDESEDLLRQAAKRLDQERAPRHAMRGLVHNALAGALGSKGDRVAADSHFTLALAAYDQDSVRERRARAFMLSNWGVSRSMQGDPAGGAAHKTRALAGLKASSGTDIWYVRIQVQLIDDLLRLGRLAEADSQAAEAQRIVASLATTHDLERVQLQRQRGVVAVRQRRLSAADMLLAEAARGLATLNGTTRVNPEIRVQQSLAELAEVRGRLEEADAHHRRAVELATANRGPKHPVSLSAVGQYAGYLRRAGRTAQADSVRRDSVSRAPR